MRVLVAGATGVLGTATVPRLVAAGHDVVAVSRREEADAALRESGAVPVRVDLFDVAGVARAATGVDAVVNLATHIPAPPAALRQRAWRINDRLRSEASGVLADAAIRHGVRFVQESFAPTYRGHGDTWITEDHPLDPVAQTRTVPVAESHAQRVTEAGGAGVVLRFGLFYSASSADGWLDAAAKGRLMLPGPPDHYSSMVHVADAASAVVAALTAPAGTYNVVEDEPMTRGEHAAVLGEVLGRGPLKPLPTAVARIPVLRVLSRSHRISNRRLRAATDWRPQVPSVREGWRHVVARLTPVDQ